MPLPNLIKRAGLTKVTIVKAAGTDDEQRIETEAQLLNSNEAYFAIEDPIDDGDHVEMPDLRGGAVTRQAVEAVQHPVPASMRSTHGGTGYTKVRWGKVAPPRQAPVRRLALESLHRRVVEVASAKFADGSYDAAVTEAMKSVDIRVRELTGLKLSGVPLVQEALKPKGALLDVSVEDGRSGEDEREGYFYLFRGAMLGVRNPRAHELSRDDDPYEALEMLGLASLLHRRLDTAESRLNQAT